jgi:molybdopterin-guanine dinucleotide biosynthesis protein A
VTTLPAGVLLTGGSSRRLGVDKAQLRLPDGATLAEHAATVLLAVCGRCVEVGPGRSGLPATRESPAGAGPLAALVAGVRALDDEGPIVLLGCDYPRLDATALRAVVQAPPPTTTAIARARDRLHYVCARYSADAIVAAAARLAAGERALRWIEALPHVAVDLDPAVLLDVDTPDDAAALGLRGDTPS